VAKGIIPQYDIDLDYTVEKGVWDELDKFV